MDQKICSSCNHENSSKNYFCTQCGSKLVVDNEIRPRLSVLFGEPRGAIFLLRKGRNTIGHDCGNTIILGDEHISNKHAAIVFKADQYWIEDRSSKNSVYLNGDRITEPSRLLHGSVLKLGQTILKFENGGQS